MERETMRKSKSVVAICTLVLFIAVAQRPCEAALAIPAVAEKMKEQVAQNEVAGVVTLAELVPHFLNKPLQFDPGTKWQYCQSGINTAGRIVEIVSGQSLDRFVQERIFSPLEMKDTSFYPSEAQTQRIAKSYKKADG